MSDYMNIVKEVFVKDPKFEKEPENTAILDDIENYIIKKLHRM